MRKWSAIKVNHLDDWSEANNLRQDRIAYCPFIPYMPDWHRYAWGDRRFTGARFSRIYVGLRSSSQERKAGVWRTSDYWVFSNSVAARIRMELEYRLGYLVRVQELPALVLTGHRKEFQTPTSITPETSSALVLAELGTDTPLEIYRENVVLRPALASLLMRINNGSIRTFEQLFKRLPPCGPGVSLKAWVGGVSRLQLPESGLPAIARPYLTYSRGYVRKETLARGGALKAWKRESSDIRFEGSHLLLQP